MGVSIFDLAKANEVRKFMKTNDLEFLAKSIRIIEMPDGSAIVRQEIKLKSKAHAEIFVKQFDLADKAAQYMDG